MGSRYFCKQCGASVHARARHENLLWSLQKVDIAVVKAGDGPANASLTGTTVQSSAPQQSDGMQPFQSCPHIPLLA